MAYDIIYYLCAYSIIDNIKYGGCISITRILSIMAAFVHTTLIWPELYFLLRFVIIIPLMYISTPQKNKWNS